MNSSSAYDLTMLNAIPLPERHVEEVPVPHVVKPRPPKSELQLKREARLSTVEAIRIIVITGIMFALFAGIIASRVKLSLAQHETESLKSSLSIVESENVRLNMQLEAMVSDETVEDYAVNVLGLKKVEKYQIHYFENDSADSAVVYGNK